MNLLDKYILELGKHLPRKNCADLQAEIRSTLEDMLEDRSRQSGRPVDEGLTAEVLKEYGAPVRVAAAYQPARYLIGPRMYPFFIMVLKIVTAVLFAVSLGGLILAYYRGGGAGAGFAEALGRYALQFLGGAVSALGNIVLVFAVLERVLPASEFEDQAAEKWDPSALNAEPDPDEARRSEMVFEILFTVLGLVLLNLYPNLVGIGMLRGTAWLFFPALSEAFFRYLPWINLLGVLQIALDLYLLRQGAWQLVTRLIAVTLEVAGIALAVVMLNGPSLVDLNPAYLEGLPAEAASVLGTMMNYLPVMVLVILIVVQSVEVLNMILKLAGRKTEWKNLLPKF